MDHHQEDKIEALTKEIIQLKSELSKAIKSKEHTEAWYAVRIRRLTEFLKKHNLWHEGATILANGIESPNEPPTYDVILNVTRHDRDKAEKELSELKSQIQNKT